MKADKASITVVLNKDDYRTKIYEILDYNVYTILKEDPTDQIS